ncbi:hypothetical protein ACJMK2_032363 [Sinanodonta woodiana]|uniref:Uncharacterized protein n=1 Tax=Sinanodonta woodiana TaxID=1069815 RepID=A0ABD3X1H9_SINWO
MTFGKTAQDITQQVVVLRSHIFIGVLLATRRNRKATPPVIKDVKWTASVFAIIWNKKPYITDVRSERLGGVGGFRYLFHEGECKDKILVMVKQIMF